jgi:uncharacterized repeat protein (TIGR01451 family)/fimbrial isopeptide formation D2 family protein
MQSFLTKMSKPAAAILIALLVAAIAISRSRAGDPTDSGTVITNRAEATYEGTDGVAYRVASETVTFTVLAVPSLTVGPKQTAPSASVAPQQRVERLFNICNTGNIPSSYVVTNLDVTSPSKLVILVYDNDASGTITLGDTLITVGETSSVSIAPRGCVGVLVVIDTLDISPGSLLQIRLTARTNGGSGSVSDTGTIINSTGRGPQLSSPNSAALPPLKQVNGGNQAVLSRGNLFNYSIAFRNSGDVAARNFVLIDELPPGISYAAGSLEIDNNDVKPLTDAQDADEGFVQGQHIEIRLGDLPPDRVVRLNFKARLNSDATGASGIVNVAQLSADNATSIKTNSVVVIADPFGTVFSGRGGASSPVAGARVSLFNDQTLANLVQLQIGNGFLPNGENANPFNTDYLGHFSFALNSSQVGTPSSPSKYFVNVTAPGFQPRLIEITVQPDDTGLFSIIQRALDNQPLAVAGGFTLVNENVRIDELAALAFNIPIFEEHGLDITKAVDQQRAEIGDVVTYRIELRNPTSAPIKNVTVNDRLPEGFSYVSGTARVVTASAAERSIEPESRSETLVFQIGEIPAGASARLLYRVRIGANSRPGEKENVAVGSGEFPSGQRSITGAARATVRVGGGVFSTQQLILGRVFEDVNRNGSFDGQDKPIPGVRLYLTSGQSVITDSQGLYNFPSVGDGSQVMAIDPITVPAGFVLADGGSLAGQSWTRLLRTPLGGGALLRQNFSLVRSSDASKLAGKLERQVETPTASNSSPQLPKTSDLVAASALQSSSSFAANSPADSTPTAAGTYEVTSNETIEPIAPGTVLVLSPVTGSTVMSPALELSARVALDWTVKLEVNGDKISEKNIGTKRLDHKNNVATYNFVSVSLRPGPNRVRVTPVGPDGSAGRSQELTVHGRGPAERLEVIPERSAIQAGGRDSTLITIRAFDKWGHPANDNQVGIETSLGELVRLVNKPTDSNGVLTSGVVVDNADLPLDVPLSKKENRTQLVVQMDKGEAAVRLIGPGHTGDARLHVVAGKLEVESAVRILPERRPRILLGLAEMTFGSSIPEVGLRGEQGKSRNRLSLFYSGPLWGENSLTLSYDSQRPINRTSGRDRLFQLDPLDRAYPVFGDSSTRFEAAQSNSKLFARVDRGRSYLMFGDLDADMSEVLLAGYTRKLTGVKLRLENSKGDFVTVTGARPDTSFARDVFPAGGLSLIRLTHGEILQGSETVAVEVRDRRNPEIIISRELLARSIDYNLDPTTGEIFLLRNISTFDSLLNLRQLVVTYEHEARGMTSSVYTARGQKNFRDLGLRLGFSSTLQRQETYGSFMVGGLDLEKTLPRRGLLKFAWARSEGETNNQFGGLGGEKTDLRHDGNAFNLDLYQPLGVREAVVRARFAMASEGFLNPFGGTVTPGSRRGEVAVDFKPRKGLLLRLGVTSEDNKTANVDNSRLTLSVAGEQVVHERLKLHFGYDRRRFSDDLSGTTTNSDLVTVGATVQVTDKIDVSIKREQNLGDPDPGYPTQTTLTANYKVNLWTRIFLTQRLASAPIVPIGDFSQSGFAASNARRETAFGVESRFGKYTAVVGRYQLENGINGQDSFAVIGLQNRLPLTKEFSLELGFERGFHLTGDGDSFNSATLGFGWTPNENFKASARYEFRDRGGNGQLFSIGAAGKLSEGITVLSRLRWSDYGFNGRDGSSIDGLAALAIRPLKTDRAGLLFSFNHRSLEQSIIAGAPATRDRINTAAADGYYQATRRLELYGRFALRFVANGQADLPFVSTLTYLSQARAQYRITSRIDWAAETRLIMQPSSRTQRSIYGTEVGFWAIPDLRLGLGYNFNAANEPAILNANSNRRGFYFAISSKLSNLFDLFGTSKSGLENQTNGGNTSSQQSEEPKQ